MKSWLLLAGAVIFFSSAAGCGEDRVDPRSRPDFNEEAYNDPNEAMKSMSNSSSAPKTK